ncbi:MAG: D-aminoacyl-tRNA deacylase [Paludibacteraceae bacterium]|nr:D-aminoacyl-tRNA deacylase [Paludibacteraceae bacterium]
MRTIIQRVKYASVTIDEKIKSKIEKGLLVLIGIEDIDTDDDIEYLASKISMLRIFDDEHGVMNKSVMDIDGEILVVSQFTLFASTKKGNRPSYIRASKGDFAIPMYEKFCQNISKKIGKEIGTGEFGADMKVELLNDGPVTIIMDSKNKDL